jgi:protein gp37
MNKTKIDYLNLTWNPTVGCEGLGCAVRQKCWARAMAKRRKHRCKLCYTFAPHVHFERFDQPLQVKKPSRIGVSFMGDFYDKGIARHIQASLFIRMEKASWHTFIILTKQPQNIDLNEGIPRNVWLGVTVNRKQDLWRIIALRWTEAKIKFVSFEPLYEDLGKIDLKGIDWIIIGAQTRPLLRPNVDWVNNINFQATALKIPIFEKNNLGYPTPLKEIPKIERGLAQAGGIK